MSSQGNRAGRGGINRVAPVNPDPVENRDPNNLNSHIITDYFSVFGEPSTAPQSIECVWEFSEICYDCMRECTYKLMGLFCGVCIAIAWAFEFVPVLFSHVWFLTPCNHVISIVCGIWCKSFWHLWARLCVAPCTKSCAYFFANCGYGIKDRPESPPLFPRKPKKKAVPKPEKKVEPKVEEKNEPPVVVVAAARRSEFEDMDKEKVANSVRRQLML